MTDAFGNNLRWGRYCMSCNQHYTDLKAIGKWQCLFHPLPVNRDGPGRHYPEGCYECCGASPYARLPNGNRNPNFRSGRLEGCTRKDHSAVQMFFCEDDDLPMHTWPELLTAELCDDLNKLTEGVDPSQLQHPGIQIKEDLSIYIQRYDKKHVDYLKSGKRFK